MSTAQGQRPVLVIAGSDPSGGAGIEADIKTLTALGAYATTSVTALTVQDTSGVADILPIPVDFVGQQLTYMLADIKVEAVKIGLLGSADMVRTIAAALEHSAPGIPIVLDPVMASSSGTRFLDDEGLAALKTTLLPMVRLVTPNLSEAAAMTGLMVESPEDMKAAAAALVDMGAAAALVTGGHLEGAKLCDVLAEDGNFTVFEDQRIDSPNTHGTGCTLSSAIAAGLAEGKSLEMAVGEARQFVRRAIAAAPGLGRGQGPLGHSAAGPDGD